MFYFQVHERITTYENYMSTFFLLVLSLYFPQASKEIEYELPSKGLGTRIDEGRRGQRGRDRKEVREMRREIKNDGDEEGEKIKKKMSIMATLHNALRLCLAYRI